MILVGDAFQMLAQLDSNSIDCCVTSPPYWGLRDYGVAGQLGLEKTPEEYVNNMRLIFEQVKRVLKPEGTLWLNLGDSYVGGGNNRGNTSPISGKQKSNTGATGQVAKHGLHKFKSETLKPKDLCGIPWRVALALQSDGWYLRQDIIWHKPNPMPESVRDRCTKAHEYIFLLSKSPKYYFDHAAIKEQAVSTRPSGNADRKQRPSSDKLMRGAQAGSIPWQTNLNRAGSREGLFRNKRSVWTVPPKPFKGAHFATFPPDLIEPCILAGCPEYGIVLDPFFGAGTVGLVAAKHKRNFIGIELNQEYVDIAKRRLGMDASA